MLEYYRVCSKKRLSNRFSPCFVEHHNFLGSDVKSRIHAGDVIDYF